MLIAVTLPQNGHMRLDAMDIITLTMFREIKLLVYALSMVNTDDAAGEAISHLSGLTLSTYLLKPKKKHSQWTR